MILFYWGDTYIPVKNMTLGMKFNTEAKQYGFQDGDILVGTNKGEFKDFSADMYRDLSEATRADIIRDGKAMSINLPGEINLLGMLKAEPSFVRPLIPAVVDSVIEGTPAAQMGLQKGDKIVAINGKPVDSYNEFTDQLGVLEDMMTGAKTQADSLKIRTVSIAYEREGLIKDSTDASKAATAMITDTAAVTLTPELKLGFMVKTIAGIYEPITKEYGAKSIGGFGAIGSLFPPVWDWYLFWKMTAFLSIILAFMNILPIPALDGGHVLFLMYEMITRRKPSETFMIRAEYVGFGLLILLMVFANLNDILRWLGYM
jgi:regulator of sigma E protease